MKIRTAIEAFAEQAACRSKAELFTAEARDLRAGTRRRMAAICGTCPVFDMCAQLRDTIHPTCGMWAGKVCTNADGRR